jgi:hypothetical protein
VKYLLLAGVLVACSPSARNIQIATANAVAVAANQAAPLIVAEYRKAGAKCIDDATNITEADVCMTQLESRYSNVRIAWMGMRRTQAEWADALKKSDPKISDYMVSMEHAYCDLIHEVPSVPAVPGLACQP